MNSQPKFGASCKGQRNLLIKELIVLHSDGKPHNREELAEVIKKYFPVHFLCRLGKRYCNGRQDTTIEELIQYGAARMLSELLVPSGLYKNLWPFEVNRKRITTQVFQARVKDDAANRQI